MLTIAPLTPADRAAWERLFRGYIAFYERDEPQAMYDLAWAAFMAGDRLHALGARQGDALVGITHFFVHPSTSGPDVCYLQDLFTDAAARGQGVGKALIEAVATQAKAAGAARYYWQTHETNLTAQRLYDQVAERSGFIVYRGRL